MSDTRLTTTEPTMSLARFLPQNIADLTRFADTVAKSGLFGSVTPQQATVLMMYGAELGVNPLAAMREIYLIEGRNGRMQMLPSAALTSARIQQSEDLEAWEADTSAKKCTIRFKRKGRTEQSVTVSIDDIPQRYFAQTRSGQPSQWSTIPEDMLYAWTVRRVARRHFADKLIAIQPEDEWIDESRVIDVAKVERTMPDGEKSWPCTACQSGRMFLHSNPNGGVYLRCAQCNATDVPPPEVRDLVRGAPAALTIAATAATSDTTSGESIEPVSTAHSQDRAQSGPDRAERSSDEAAALPTSNPSLPESEVPASDLDPEPPVDAPVDAAENTGGSPVPDTHEDSGEPSEAEPAVADPVASDSGSPLASVPETREAESAVLTPRDQLREFLRQNRTATGQRHIAIRDALLEAGWDGTTGISQLCADLPDDAIAKLLKVFAAPSFGTVE